MSNFRYADDVLLKMGNNWQWEVWGQLFSFSIA